MYQQIKVYEINQIETKVENNKILVFKNKIQKIEGEVKINLDSPGPSRFHIYMPEKNIITKLFNSELKPKSKLSYVKPSFAKEGIYNLIAYDGGGILCTKKIINLIDKYSLYPNEHRYFCFEIKYCINNNDMDYSVKIKIIDYDNVVTFMYKDNDDKIASITKHDFEQQRLSTHLYRESLGSSTSA